MLAGGIYDRLVDNAHRLKQQASESIRVEQHRSLVPPGVIHELSNAPAQHEPKV